MFIVICVFDCVWGLEFNKDLFVIFDLFNFCNFFVVVLVILLNLKFDNLKFVY